MTTSSTGETFNLRPTHAIVDLAALAANVQYLKSLAPRSKFMAVVKANAYGHGFEGCSKALDAAGVDAFCVALGEEGLKLRRAGITKPILVFGAVFSERIDPFIVENLTMCGSSIAKLDAIAATATRMNKKALVHLKIDTGMGRVGVRPSSAEALFKKALSLPALSVTGVFTHFADSDGEDPAFTHQQLKLFLETRKVFYTIFGDNHPALFHAANSAALIRFPETHLDMVRPGIALFGIVPDFCNTSVQSKLKPVLSLHSEVGFFKVVKAGESVSYGRTWFANEDTRVVTIPIGYGDGYSRALSNNASVIIRNQLHSVIGRICMDQLMVSVGSNEAYVGDVVTLIGGAAPGPQIRVEDLARQIRTIPYEILTQLNERIPRIFKN